jgi:hypothetical protein
MASFWPYHRDRSSGRLVYGKPFHDEAAARDEEARLLAQQTVHFRKNFQRLIGPAAAAEPRLGKADVASSAEVKSGYHYYYFGEG